MLAYVEFKEPKAFRPVKGEGEGKDYGLNYNLGTSVTGPILYAAPGPTQAHGWDLQRAGTSLVMLHRKTGVTYECPWDDVKVALHLPEEAPPEKKTPPDKKGAKGGAAQ